jgi:cell division protein FtsQ
VPADQVRAAVQDELGRPLLLTDLGGVASRVRALPGVRDVTVTRRWPSTLTITVVERRVLAGVPAGEAVRLVDEDGVELAVVGVAQARAAGAPLVDVDPRAGVRTLRAAADVQRQLPGRVRALVREVSAATPDTVRLTLSDASQVLWGSAQDGEVKAAALLALRGRTPGGSGVSYDVSAPGVPAVSVRAPGR